MVIVAARPSVGKTAFALNLAANHAKNGGSSILFSLEMGTKQLLQRMVSSVGRINGQKWRTMAFNEDDYDRALHAIGEISRWKLKLYDKLRTISEMRGAIRKQIIDHPNERHVVLIDYLQLITPADVQARRDLEIGVMTRELKLLAVELDVPIVLLSQLSRGVESRQNKRPLMSDLRESGNIEQDADVISFLYRDDYYSRETVGQSRMEVILAKQRNGPTGTIELAFDKPYGRFCNLTGEGTENNEEPRVFAVEGTV
ncbi:DnaB helicase C-terminal domain-containing protein [Lentibacillus sp. N15]|uniref:replicative DNA helicase n=1 Tax=Lentibacillus songyuanensis TaxID=3136161 RepID=UPI0031BA1520